VELWYEAGHAAAGLPGHQRIRVVRIWVGFSRMPDLHCQRGESTLLHRVRDWRSAEIARRVGWSCPSRRRAARARLGPILDAERQIRRNGTSGPTEVRAPARGAADRPNRQDRSSYLKSAFDPIGTGVSYWARRNYPRLALHRADTPPCAQLRSDRASRVVGAVPVIGALRLVFLSYES